jgi:hypothetical protein
MKREPGSLSVPQWTHPSLVEKRFNHQHCLTNRGEEEEGVVMCTRGYGMVADPGFMCNFAPGLHLYRCIYGPILGAKTELPWELESHAAWGWIYAWGVTWSL